MVAATARAASVRHSAPTPGRSAGTSGAANQRSAPPKSRIWSMVWGDPTSWSEGGRSAVHTSRGTPA